MSDIKIGGAPLVFQDLVDGASLLVDKPLGWTSFDVVNKLRWAIRNKLGKKKYKVGHAGTLDPLASGLLLICISHHTKRIESYMGHSKKYIGQIELFKTTATYDAEMLPDCYYPHRDFLLEDIQAAANGFIGEISQKPPAFSAIKHKGVALYKLARAGREVAIENRQVHISQFKIVDYEDPVLEFEVACSKGTYIRSLAYDLGRHLHTGAYLKSLRRTAIGSYCVEDAWDLNTLVHHINSIQVTEL